MKHHKQQNHISKGKFTVLTLALAGALTAMTAAQAQTTTITSADGSGQLTWSSNDLLLDSTASITAGTGVITGSTSLGTLTNQGTINSANKGIYNVNGRTITLLDNQAVIHGSSSGIANRGTIGTLINSGTISSGNTAIYTTGSIGTLINTSTGTLTAVSVALYNSTGTIDVLNNSGTITSSLSLAIDNSGLITSLSNDGLISGNLAGIYNENNGTISTLTNSGTITSSISNAVYNSGLITSLSNDGLLKGSTLTSSHLSGLYNESIGNIDTLTNSGTISGDNGLSNLGTIGILDNSGTITGIHTGGIYNVGTIGTLINSGLISNDNDSGIYNGGLISVLNNDGTITGVGYGIYNTGVISTLTNNGTIRSTGTSAIGIYNNGGHTIGTLVNNGLISGDYAAIYLDSSSTLSSFTNTGTIAGNIENHTSSALTINGGSGTIFGTLTGYSGGISSTDIGSIISETDLSFTGNQLLNDNIVINGGTGTVTNAGVLQLNNPVTIYGSYIQDADATLLIGVTSSASFSGSLLDTGYGRLVVNGDAVIASGSTITLKSLGYSFAQGQRYVVIAASGSGTNYNASSLVYSATGYTVTATVQTDSSNSAYSDLVLTLGSSSGSDTDASSTSNTSPINNATTSNAVAALNGLFKYGGTDAEMLAVFNPATALDTAAANKAGAQLSPSAVTSAAAKAVDEATQAISNVLTSHIDGLRLAQSAGSGVATGEGHNDIALWGQVFGGRAGQALRDNVSGYHANYRGLLIGADSPVMDKVRVGALVSAARTNVASDDDNTGSSATVNSYGLTAYATYTGSPWYVNVLAGATRQQYSTIRSISYTGFSGIASGSYRGLQYLTSVQAGYPLNLDAWLPGATLTPLAGLSYSTLRQSGYTETGGSGAALNVNASSSNSLKSELGVRLENSYKVSYGKLLPSVQLGWRHEYKDSATQTGASFVADSTGATAFVTQSATPVANTAVLNLGLTLVQSNNLSLTGKYTLETGGGYLAQTGSVQVRWQY